jgi:hypothetical protein
MRLELPVHEFVPKKDPSYLNLTEGSSVNGMKFVVINTTKLKVNVIDIAILPLGSTGRSGFERLDYRMLVIVKVFASMFAHGTIATADVSTT